MITPKYSTSVELYRLIWLLGLGIIKFFYYHIVLLTMRFFPPTHPFCVGLSPHAPIFYFVIPIYSCLRTVYKPVLFLGGAKS